MVGWTNSGRPIQSLSKVCPIFVQSLSNVCENPMFVQGLSKLCPSFIQGMSVSKLYPVVVQRLSRKICLSPSIIQTKSRDCPVVNYMEKVWINFRHRLRPYIDHEQTYLLDIVWTDLGYGLNLDKLWTFYGHD